MIRTLLGPDGFRRGMDAYIACNDNRAATIGDFLAAMQQGSGIDLGDVAMWYTQAGTPEITVEGRYDPESCTYELVVQQHVPPTPGQPEKRPMPIPIAMGLLGPNGDELPTRLEDENEARTGTRVLVAASERQVFRFADVPAPPVPSLLRNFSAPVKLRGVPLDQLKFLAVHDTDPVARWDAGQQVATRMLLDRSSACRAVPRCRPSIPMSVAACGRLWPTRARDPAFAAEALALPSETNLAEEMPVIAVEAIHRARESARADIAAALAGPLSDAYERFADRGPYRIDGEAIGRRALRNICLGYLAAGDPREGARLAKAQFDAGANMTDVLAALSVLIDIDCPEREAALDAFYKRWADDPLVIDKWFALAGALVAARHDRAGPCADRASGLYSRQPEPGAGAGWHVFAGQPAAFSRSQRRRLRVSRRGGAGARQANPTTAARLVQPLGQWRRHDAARQGLMRAALDRILATPGLSPNTYEMVAKSLEA